MSSIVTEVSAAPSPQALEHFQMSLRFETDCWDVQHALGHADFVLLDVRSAGVFAAAHVPGALNIPHAQITAEGLERYPPQTLFVVYCAGPHCNGAQRAAIRLARLGRPVKIMLGGMSGWREENFPIARGAGEAVVA
jgi:rhodanese-related sulfurtransferase